MLKKLARSFDKSSEHDEENQNRRGGKFGSKIGKIFRVFKRDSGLNQSRQQLNPEIEVIGIENQNYMKDKNSSGKVEVLGTTDVSSDSDFGSQTNLVLDGKEDVEKIEKIESKNEKKSAAGRIRRLRRTENVKSNEMEPNSVDVVVDVHYENSEKNVFQNTDDDMMENISEFDSDKKVILSSVEKSVDSVKKQRKRWSKTSVVLPPKRNSLSSNNSMKSSPLKNLISEVKPIPAPRTNKITNLEKSEVDFGVENVAFESDDDDENEEVLRIETEVGSIGTSRIEMTSINSNIESMIKSPANLRILEKKKIRKFHGDTLDDSEDSEMEKKPKRLPRSHRNISSETVIDLENSDSSLSPKRPKKVIENVMMKNIEGGRKKLSISEISDGFSRLEDSESLSETQKFARAQISSTDDDDKTKRSRRESRIKHKKKLILSSRESGLSLESTRNDKTGRSIRKTRKSRLKKTKTEETKFISILIIKADMLLADYVTRHPMVIAHIVEAKTGNYLKLPENKKNEKFYLQPLITGTFDFKLNKSMVPIWDEELIFENNFQALMGTGNDQVLILFEVVDLLSFAEASHSYDQFGSDNCWYKIAWAFLKPSGSSGTSHVDKQVRLQLYKPKRTVRKTPRHKCEAYLWWKSNSREKYPSTLYVAVSPVDPPKLEPVYYGQLPINDIPTSLTESSNGQNLPQESINISRWTRLAAQSCKIPNELYFQTETTENGCFYVVFSNNGKFVACANSEEYDYPIVVYEMEGRIFVKFSGHKSFIYSLDWSMNDDFLLSVSSDQTARIWDVKNRLIQEVSMLPHPSYVYCGKFDPSRSEKVATGCFDHIIRIWTKNSETFELFQELEGHEGFVNSICFQKDGSLISGDSLGVIVQWSIKKNKKSSRKDFTISKKIKIREVSNVIINTIVLHPLGSRLLVHTRDSGLRMLDLSTGIVLQKYEGLKNLRIQTTARISPCGGLLFCGGEDGHLKVWNIESGKRMAVYQTEENSSAIACVDYHPYDHVLVFSTFGVESSATILRFDKNSDGKNIGLKLLNEEESKSPDFWREKEISIGSGTRLSRRLSEASERWRNEPQKSPEIDGDRGNLKMRLKMFNDAEGTLKTKSANRLTNIIAKIDKILSNNSLARSPYDIEANNLDKSIGSISKSIDNRLDEEVSRVIPYVPPLFSNFEDNSINSVNSMSESRSRSDIIEMTDLSQTMLSKKRGKSKSARESVFPENQDDDRRIVFSDGIVQSRKKKKKSSDAPKQEEIEFQTGKFDRIKTIENLVRDSGSESAGTYIVDKVKEEPGIFEDSAESMRSDVTFVIENEKLRKPIPKPRKKKKKSPTE